MEVIICGMTSLPPRSVTFEHEAAHALVARRGGGSVDFIDITIAPLSSSAISLGHTQWRPGTGNTNTLIAGYVAGPAQTKLTVQRNGFDVNLSELAIDAEAGDLAAMLQARQQNTGRSAAEGLIRKHLSSMEEYLQQPDVQTAIQAIKDVLETAEGENCTRVLWDRLEQLVDWDGLPSLPTLQ